MKLYLRLIYKSVGFTVLFLLLGTVFVYFESIIAKNSFKSLVDESGIFSDDYEKSYIPIFASLIISYFIVFQIPWFKRNKDYY
tara:strand:+ start:2118 stop:2366 length:249 start_codon:yes stop_codon:yes gene_type:complete